MSKLQFKAIDFVKLVYEIGLVDFMGKFENIIFMKDGAAIYRAKIAKEWGQTYGIRNLTT